MADRRNFLKTTGAVALTTPTVLALGQVPAFASVGSGNELTIDPFTDAQVGAGEVAGAMIGGKRDVFLSTGTTSTIGGGLATVTTPSDSVRFTYGGTGDIIANLAGCTEIFAPNAVGGTGFIVRLVDTDGDNVGISSGFAPGGAAVNLATFTANLIDLDKITSISVILQANQAIGPVIAR